MKILSVECSASPVSCAIVENGRVKGRYYLNMNMTHSQTLMPMLDSLMKLTGDTAENIDLFAVSAGPGSFTGVRIGAATLKGLAFASTKSCVEVSTLEALAYNLRMHKGLICPVMNARRSQVYTALFRSNGETLERLMPDSAMAIGELDALLSEYGEEVCLCGDGYDITAEGFCKTPVIPVPKRLRMQSAVSVAAVALDSYRRGETCTDAELGVNYLRPSQAERERAERLAVSDKSE
jgi:tRNA threonylcarbamoyladenosine biosynthesis protein TsaB